MRNKIYRTDGTGAFFDFSGKLGELFSRHEKDWVTQAVQRNPNMITAIEKGTGYYAEKNPDWNEHENDAFVAWYGEFSGKFLEGVAYFYQLRPNENVKEVGDGLVKTFNPDTERVQIYAEKYNKYCNRMDELKNLENFKTGFDHLGRKKHENKKKLLTQ